MSGHKRIIETAAVLLAAVLVFSRGYAEQRFQTQMETLLEEYETGEAQPDNLQLTNLRVNYIPDRYTGYYVFLGTGISGAACQAGAAGRTKRTEGTCSRGQPDRTGSRGQPAGLPDHSDG